MNNIPLVDSPPSSSSKRPERPSSSSSSSKKQRKSTSSSTSSQDDLERLHDELDDVNVSIQKVEQEIDELNIQLKMIDAQLLMPVDSDTLTYLRNKESQLRNEKDHYLKEKDHLLEQKTLLLQQINAPESLAPLLPFPEFASSPCRLRRYFVPHPELSHFISPLLSEPINSISTLPMPPMKLDEIFSIKISQNKPSLPIFHRKCYSDVFTMLSQINFRCLTSSLITGTPGIGKSHSFFCFLRFFLLQKHPNGDFTRRIIGYERDYLKVVSFYELNEDGTHIYAYHFKLTLSLEQTLAEILCPSDIIFRDCEQRHSSDFSHLFLNCHETLLSSPRRKGFSTFLKGIDSSLQFVLPPFSMNEMIRFGRLMEYQQHQINDARILLRVFGGVPRYCYELVYDLQTWQRFVMLFLDTQTEPLLKLNDTNYAVLHTMREYESKDSFPHRLLFLVPNRDLHFSRFAFPSRFVEELVTVAHTLKRKTTALRYLSDEDVSKIYWRIFEHGCVQTLTSQLDALPMKRAKWYDQGGRKILRWEPVDTFFELPHRTQTLSLEELPSSIDSETLLVPLNPTNATWDALSTSALFNFTVASSHDFNKHGLTTAREILGDEHPLPPFYWMVSQKAFDHNQCRITTTADYVLNLTHYLIPRPNPSSTLLREICRREIIAKFRMALESNEAISPALKDAPPMSEELRKVIEQALRPTYEDDEDIYGDTYGDTYGEDEEGLLPSSSSS